MLDIKLIRDNPQLVRKNLEKRHDAEKLGMLDELFKKDKERLEVLKKAEELRKQRNMITKEISEAKSSGKDIEKLAHAAKAIPQQIKDLETKLEEFTRETELLMSKLPNLLHDSVPEGKDDKDNKEVRKVGKKPLLGFGGKGHAEILEKLGMLDMERAAKIAGHGFYYLKGDAVILDIALQRFALDFLKGKGFTIIAPPLMMARKPYEGVTSLGDFENVMYKIEGDDLYMIATSEHPMAAMFMNETFLIKNMPILCAGVSPCFRKEVGAHGKYTKGMFRVHNFNKIEQFVFCHPKDSWKWHENLQQNTELMYKKLGLYFRVVNVCTGDIGDIAAKKYDTECWMADGEFRETGSNSNCTDFQARSLNIKFREKDGQAPAGFVHTLNNTAIATSRIMVALIEQNQKKDGTVAIPKALQKYTGFKVLGEKKKKA
jgi:seryl-tRNA synthetase